MRSTGTLSRDDRAIEGLPIRLVIALVVGVASLAVMLQILGGIGPVGQDEVTLQYDGDAVQPGFPDGDTNTVDLGDIVVTTKNGDPVEGARILITSGTLTLEEPSQTGSVTDENGELTGAGAEITPDYRPDQQKGTVKIEIQAPSSGNYQDDEPNGEIIIAR